MAIDGERDPTIAGEEGTDGTDEDCGNLEPFFYDEAATLDEAITKRRKKKGWLLTRGAEEGGARPEVGGTQRYKAVLERISERDAETGEIYYTRYYSEDFSEFDIDKVSSSSHELHGHRDDSLILTGPHRGIVLVDALYFEIDLKLKGDQVGGAEEDKRLSKSVLRMNGVRLETIFVFDQNLLTAVRPITIDPCRRLNNLYPLQLMYAFVSDAVEATVSVKVLRGHFYGKITACTITVKDIILLHDSSLVPGGGVMAADHGNDQFASVRLLRPVMAVCLQETLMVTVLAQVDGTKYNRRTMNFKPAVNGEGEAQITCGANSLLVKMYQIIANCD
uniref:DUF6598 domain-containing protein n=1 Tax=Oryza punctata TaxID=4537 RepID=A0A0E0MPP8_ORYPU